MIWTKDGTLLDPKDISTIRVRVHLLDLNANGAAVDVVERGQEMRSYLVTWNNYGIVDEIDACTELSTKIRDIDPIRAGLQRLICAARELWPEKFADMDDESAAGPATVCSECGEIIPMGDEISADGRCQPCLDAVNAVLKDR